jgi:hypothetical protein
MGGVSWFRMDQVMMAAGDSSFTSLSLRNLEQSVCGQPPRQLVLGFRAQPILGPLGPESGQPR